MEQQLGKNTLLTSGGANWERGEDLTPQQHAILDEVNFPKAVKFPNVLLKRVEQQKNGGFYALPVGRQQLGRVSYTTTAYNAAALRNPYGDPSKSFESKVKAIQNNIKQNQRSHVVNMYFDRNHIEQEMRDILKVLTPPSVSPIVAKPPSTPNQEVKGKEDTPVEDTPKLSNIAKGKIKKLLKEGYDAGEIAEEIDKPLQLILDYVTKLNK